MTSVRGLRLPGGERLSLNVVMTTFTGSDDLRGAEFTGVDLRGARFVEADLSGAVMRAVDVAGAEIDAPWLFEDGSSLRVNGVDVTPYVEAELNRRFPGRVGRRAGDPAGLRAAWAAVERTWAATLERVAAMPAGTVDVSVGGEWSFAQTLRHLDMSVFTTVTPSYADVLEVRAARVAMVRDYLATVTPGELAETRRNPWDPEDQRTVLSCLHVILNEEWEHHRFAVRDLDAIEAKSGGRLPSAPAR
jgi:hypothetical protein